MLKTIKVFLVIELGLGAFGGTDQLAGTETMTVTILIACTLVVGGFLYIKHSSRTSDRVEHQEIKRAQPFAGVEIHCGKNACSHAKGLVGEKLLAANAPILPLTRCSAATCECRYRKIDDRREDSRRGSDVGLESLIYAAAERRLDAQRRSS